MIPRNRVLAAIDHRQPDRIPIDFWAVPEVYQQLQQALGAADREAVLNRFGADLRYFNGPAIKGQRHVELPEGVVQDHWGVLRKTHTVCGRRRDGTAYTWSYKHLLRSPLADATTVADVERHNWPTAEMWDYSGVRAQCQEIRDAGYCVVAGADRLDRAAQLKPAMYLRGVESFLADLALNEPVAECILRHVSDYYLDYNRRVFEAADGTIDVFFMGDDMGTQASTWVSPEMYRRFFKKRFAAYCELAHGCGIKTMYHTCGNVAPLVGDLIDAGLDILQSLQPRALGDRLAWLKNQYGRDLAFQGGIDIQGVLPNGSPAEVADHVRSRAEILGRGGGYIFGTAHNILPDTPTENMLALIEAYHRYGTY
ncbi:MAG TPA: uroporphyrinogen decarboxylase family protein [Phycisphaerae bacterium]|nr:uroporphyrinogen decarboxylase family protein [Phycisphaerae bacterium]HUT57901.1 uroporphyrinogen decarboxylase family protein [Phycisphaerae bacterium]